MASEVSLGLAWCAIELAPAFHYLRKRFYCPVFAEVDLNKIEPWDLPGKPKMGEQESYFFGHEDRKYATGMPSKRTTASGYWKATGKYKEILSSNRAPIDHYTGVDVSAGDISMRMAAGDGQIGEDDQDEPGQFRGLRIIFIRPDCSFTSRPLEQLKQWASESVNLPMAKERDCFHSSDEEPKPSLRFSTSDVNYNKIPWATRSKIAKECASALAYIHSSLPPYSIGHTDLKTSNILLDTKRELNISDFGLSRVYHTVPTHNRSVDAKFSGKRSAKRGIEIMVGSHMTHRRTYLSVHHHPLIQMLRSARKWSGDIFTSSARLMVIYLSNRIFGMVETGWIFAKLKYETPNAGPVSEYIIRKLFSIRNGLTVNELQQHRLLLWYMASDLSRSDHGKMAVSRKTSASWIVATGAPHHATGNRNLLSGFIMEHDDQFVHAVNQVPMKVLARGAVVTDTLILPDVWFVPGLTENLVSVSQLAELDHSIGFGRGECCIRSTRGDKIVGKGRLGKGGHYELEFLKVPLAM